MPPISPATEAMLTMAPRPTLRISGIAYLAISIIEVTLTRSAWSHSSMSRSTALPAGPPMPTLLTRMSTRPQVSTAVATAWRHCAASDTSHAAARAMPPSAVIMRSVSRAASSCISSSSTRAPRRASKIAAARPLPMSVVREPAPVTMATRPSRPLLAASAWGVREETEGMVFMVVDGKLTVIENCPCHRDRKSRRHGGKRSQVAA
ncbi:hypothetical protein D9M72_302380 [compost metagenome]